MVPFEDGHHYQACILYIGEPKTNSNIEMFNEIFKEIQDGRDASIARRDAGAGRRDRDAAVERRDASVAPRGASAEIQWIYMNLSCEHLFAYP